MRCQYLMPCQSSFTGLDPKIWGCNQALGEDRAHACAQCPCKHGDAFIWCLIQLKDPVKRLLNFEHDGHRITKLSTPSRCIGSEIPRIIAPDCKALCSLQTVS